MRYNKEHQEQTAAKIREAVRKGFRSEGYAGLSVDTIAVTAGVTSGAFYSHFRSKSLAFREVVQEGLSCISAGIQNKRSAEGALWLAKFSRWYLSARPKQESAVLLPIEGGCALPTLSPDIPRCDDETREVYQRELLRILEAIVQGLDGPKREARRSAWSILSLLTGAIILARAVPSERLAKEIMTAAQHAVMQVASTSAAGAGAGSPRKAG